MGISNPLGPGKFYGSSLPRPYIYTDVKFNSERVDPPTPFLDPLISWAKEAHWSMGGLSFTRLRLQGRIEGSIKGLRAQREKEIDGRTPTPAGKYSADSPAVAAPVAIKRKRFTVLVDEEEEEVKRVGVSERKRLARRLGEEFDRVADKSPVKSEVVAAARKRLRRSGERERKQAVQRTPSPSPSPIGSRVSPRLAKRRSGA